LQYLPIPEPGETAKAMRKTLNKSFDETSEKDPDRLPGRQLAEEGVM